MTGAAPAVCVHPDGTVVLRGWAVRHAAYALALADGDARARGRSLSRDAAVLAQVLATVAALGRGAGEPEPDPPVSDAYSTADVAAVLGVSERTVRRRARQLGGLHVGVLWRFSPAHIEMLAAQHDWRNTI